MYPKKLRKVKHNNFQKFLTLNLEESVNKKIEKEEEEKKNGIKHHLFFE